MNIRQNSRTGFVNIDMDTLQDYSIFCNMPISVQNDSTLEITIPRFIELFDELGIKATFFVIGNHAVKNKRYIRMLYENGHEIGNQTLSHQIDIGKLSSKEKYDEVVEADKILSDIIGKKIVGFRAPNYLLDKETLDILSANGYLYDSSVFPTIMSALQEVYGWLLIRRFCRIQWWALFKPVSPFYWQNGLLEVPVSVTPLTRLPFIGTYMQKLGWPYFNVTFKESLILGKNINFELHAYEILSRVEDDIPPVFRILPGINYPLTRRRAYLSEQIKKIKGHYNIVTLENYAKLSADENLNSNA